MRSAPMADLEALLNLPPLHVQVQLEAKMTVSRFVGLFRYKSGDFRGHLKICDDLYQMARHLSNLRLIYNLTWVFYIETNGPRKVLLT